MLWYNNWGNYGDIAQLIRAVATATGQGKMYFIYVLKSLKSGRFYTGSTGDIKKRLNEHNSGKSKATTNTRPFELVYQESYNSRAEAYQRELYLKTGRGREDLKNILGSSYNG